MSNSTHTPDQQSSVAPVDSLSWLALRDYLLRQSPEALCEIILDAAQRDPRLYQSLREKSTRQAEPGDALAAIRHAIEHATDPGELVEWRDTSAFAAKLEQIADSLEAMLCLRNAASLLELCQYAINRIEQALEQWNEAYGEASGVLERMSELHLKACELAQPNPHQLAEHLFRYEITFPFETFVGSARTYQHVLGAVGLQHFHELAEAEWRKITPVDNHARGGISFDSGRWRITHVMETLAEISGDVEELAAIKSRDLSSAYHFLQIAELYRKAGKPESAQEWAERGLHAFPEHPDNRLRDFLTMAYLQVGRNDEALQLTWVQMETQPNLEHYKKLREVAMRLHAWPLQRQRALQWIEIHQDAHLKGRSKSMPTAQEQSLRVEIALWENQPGEALQALERGVCRFDLLATLAEKLDAEHTEQAFPVYRRAISAALEQGKCNSAEEAAKIVRSFGALLVRNGQAAKFMQYLFELKLEHRDKIYFVALLEQM